MSLTKTSLGLAHMIASSLADQNVELGTVPNTSVDELTRLSTGVLEMQESIHPAGRANVTMLSMADALEAGASATTDEAHYPHSGAMERFAQNAGRVLASTLDLTQNKVTPMIGRVVEAINRTVTERLQGMDSPLTLVERKDDPMLSSHYLQENVARYAGYPTGMRLRNFGLGACSWNLAGTGHSGMDSEVAEFTNRVGQEKINWVCNALFNGGAANSSEIYGLADQFENSVIAYFLAIQGLTNVPDGINCSLEEWNSYCSQIVSTAGAAIAYVMSRRDKVNATGLLVVSAPLNGATIGGSSSPRSELREFPLIWNGAGSSVLDAMVKVVQVPSDGLVIVGQVHGHGSPPLIMIYYLYDHAAGTGQVIAKLQETPIQGPPYSKHVLATGVDLGETFSYQLKVENNHAMASVDGGEPARMAMSPAWDGENFYFKAGAYLHMHGDSASEGGRVKFYRLAASHPNDGLLINSRAILPPARAGSPYLEQLYSTGGRGGATWKLVSGHPPAGLRLAPDGVLSGTPEARAVSERAHWFMVQVSDVNGSTHAKTFSIVIRPAAE